MRSRPLTWLLVSVMLFVTGACLWRLGDRRAAERPVASSFWIHPPSPVPRASRTTPEPRFPLLIQAGPLSDDSPTHRASRITHPLSLRLSNTLTPLRQLIHSPTAILLENALLDTT